MSLQSQAWLLPPHRLCMSRLAREGDRCSNIVHDQPSSIKLVSCRDVPITRRHGQAHYHDRLKRLSERLFNKPHGFDLVQASPSPPTGAKPTECSIGERAAGRVPRQHLLPTRGRGRRGRGRGILVLPSAASHEERKGAGHGPQRARPRCGRLGQPKAVDARWSYGAGHEGVTNVGRGA